MKQYYISVNNQELGPLPEAEVIDLIKRGYIPNISRCKISGSNEWHAIKELEEFSSYFDNLESSWDEKTIIAKIKNIEKQNSKNELQNEVDAEKTKIKKNLVVEDKEELDFDKTIISPLTIKFLEEEKKKVKIEKPKPDNIAIKTLARIDPNKTVIIKREDYLPSKIQEEENNAESEWQKIEKQKEEKTKSNKKKGSIAVFIIVLLGLFLFLPDEDEKKQEVKTKLNYVLPVFDFPQSYTESDEDLSKEQLLQAKDILKNYSFENLLQAAPILKNSYEANDQNKDALNLLTLTYSLMIQHAENKTDAANTVFKLLHIIGEGQELFNIDVLTAKVYFLLYLEKYQAVKFLMEQYNTINKKVTPLLFAGYLKALIEVGDLVEAKKITEKLLLAHNKNPYVYSAVLEFYKVNNDEKEFWKIFNQALTEHQKSVLILLQGAYFYIKREDPDRSGDILKRIKSLEYGKSRHYYAIYLSYLGEYLAIKKNPKEAAEVLKESLDLEENKYLRIRLAALKANAENSGINTLIIESKSVNFINKSKEFLEKFEWDLALTNAIRAVDVYPKYYPAIRNLAKVQSRLGYFDLAIKNLEKFRKDDPNNLDLNVELLKVYTDAYKLSSAGDLVAILSQTNMVNSEYFSIIMADYYKKKGEVLKSILWLQQAVKINPLGDKNLFLLAQSYIKNNNIKVAKDLLIRAMSIDPANVQYRSLYADILYELNGVEPAIGYLRQILKEIPDDPILLNKIAILYYRSGQIKVFDDLVKELKKLPDGANDLNLFLMESAQREGRMSDFIQYANEYLRNDPGDLNIRLALVEAYYSINNYPVAKEHLALAKQRMPTYPKINYFEAKIALAEGKKDDALTAILQETKENPNLEMAHILLGDLYNLKDEVNEADKSYRMAQRINPNSVDALKGIAALKVKKNELPVAIELYNKALTWRPDDASLQLVLADLYRQMGQTQDAVKAYKNFLEMEPEYSEKDKIEKYLKSVHQ